MPGGLEGSVLLICTALQALTRQPADSDLRLSVHWCVPQVCDVCLADPGQLKKTRKARNIPLDGIDLEQVWGCVGTPGLASALGSLVHAGAG